MTPLRIEPATFQLVAQCLSQLPHRVPRQSAVDLYINHTYLLVFRRISVPPVSHLTVGLKCEVKSSF